MLSNYGVSNNHNNSSFNSQNSTSTTDSASQSASNSFSQSLNSLSTLGANSSQTMMLLSLMNMVLQLLTQMQSGGENSGANHNDGNTSNTGTAANNGNTGTAANNGNTGTAANNGNTGTAANNGNNGAAGNNGGYAGNNGQSAAAPEVNINIPASTGDSNTVQFRDTNGNWQALNPNQPPNQNLQPEDIRLSNNSQGTTIGGTSGGAQLVQNGDSFTINFEDRFHSNAPNDNDFNDVSVTIKNAPTANTQNNTPTQETAPNTPPASNNGSAGSPGHAPGTPDCEVAPAPTPKPAEETAPPPKLDPVGIKDGAKTWGDPHFVGAEGGKFDVQGEAGKTYNILSDQDIQVNSEFRDWGGQGATVMGDIGLTLGDDKVSFNADGQLTVNGEVKEDGSYLDGAITKEGSQVKVDHGEYKLTLDSVDNARGNYLNMAYDSDNVAADGVMPHGIWGQTADGDGEARNGDKGKGAQGGGAIEGLDGEITASGDKTAVTHYEVGSLFDTSFTNFNRFESGFTKV